MTIRRLILASLWTLAPGVTMFQIAIAIAAITVLTKQKMLWYVSLAFGGVGIYILMAGTVLAKHAG